MISWVLSQFGRKIVYACEWGEYETRYNGLDYMMTRPIHEDMSVAPPWAKRKIVKGGYKVQNVGQTRREEDSPNESSPEHQPHKWEDVSDEPPFQIASSTTTTWIVSDRDGNELYRANHIRAKASFCSTILVPRSGNMPCLLATNAAPSPKGKRKMGVNTFAIFDPSGKFVWTSQPYDIASPEDFECHYVRSVLTGAYSEWEDMKRRGYRCSPVTICDRERLERFMEAAESVAKILDSEYPHLTKRIMDAMNEFEAITERSEGR